MFLNLVLPLPNVLCDLVGHFFVGIAFVVFVVLCLAGLLSNVSNYDLLIWITMKITLKLGVYGTAVGSLSALLLYFHLQSNIVPFRPETTTIFVHDEIIPYQQSSSCCSPCLYAAVPCSNFGS
jgi:hypothetical protein